MTRPSPRRRSDSAHVGIILLVFFFGLIAIGAVSFHGIEGMSIMVDGHAVSGPVEAIIATILGVIGAILAAIIAICAALFGVAMGLFGAAIGLFGALLGVGVALIVAAGPLIVIGLIVWAIVVAASGGKPRRSSLED